MEMPKGIQPHLDRIFHGKRDLGDAEPRAAVRAAQRPHVLALSLQPEVDRCGWEAAAPGERVLALSEPL